MTSVLPEAESKVARMKQKLMNDLAGKEEARSFLAFSRENLSISQSDIERGFNKYRVRPWRNTILTLVALTLSLVCLGVEVWRFHCTTVNMREIEDLKRTVENLKHRLLKEDLLDELKAFEEQLYAESNDDDDPGETDMDNVDYDEESFSSHDYSADYQDIPKYGAKPSDFPDFSSTIVPVPTPPELGANKATLDDLLAMVRKIEAKHESKKARKLGDRQEKEYDRDLRNSTKISTSSKNKRSIEEGYGAKGATDRRQARNKTRRMLDVDTSSWESLQHGSDVEQNASSRHPPKKYSDSTKRLDVSAANGIGELNLKSMAGNRSRRVSHELRKQLHRTQNTVAFHLHGNKNGRSEGIDYYGNGKIRHKNSVFKAWKPSDWVSEFNMSKHFVLAEDGKVTVKTSGLYLVYGQIHYHDNSPELGFHIEVNGQPILQCMIDNSICQRNISQTCYSAQLTPLRRNDVLTFKEVAFTRSVIFDKVNSFFGLVKLGELPRRDE